MDRRNPNLAVLSLYAAAREYVSWTFSATDTIASVDAHIDGAWNPCAVVGNVATLLVAGPDAASNPDGTLVLAAGPHDVLLRFNDTPELPVRAAGRIVVLA